MIKTIVILFYNVLRIGFYKLKYGKRYNVHYIQRISPSCNLQVFQQGKLNIGRNTEFASGCDFQVHGQGKLIIGERTYFNRYCMISAHQSVKIGANCMFGPSVKIFDNNHRFTKEDGVSSALKTDEIVIGNNCWIASNVIILKGTHIGDNCVIGTGCIVSGDIPSRSIVKCKTELEISEIH